jgi:hypothetical protein
MRLENRLVAAFAGMLALVPVGPAPACGPERLTTADVTGHAADGDIRLGDGRVLRLAGLDAGEAGPGFGAFLGPGDRLAYGLLEETPDRWGRLPALVFLLQEGDAPVFLQGLLLRQGKARLRPEPGLGDCLAPLLAEEAGGRAARAGVFAGEGAALPAGRTPDDPAALAGRFVVLEGRLVRVGEGRRQLFLNFSRMRDEGFLVTVDKRLEGRFRTAGVELKQLSGTRLRLRGITSPVDGRRLRLERPEQIERLGR